jgi:uncharacterized protein (DUF1778 family)
MVRKAFEATGGESDGPTVIELKAHRFNLRLTSAEKALVEHAAHASCVSASRFMVQAAVRAAEEAIARQNRFVLPAVQWAEFAAKLDRPARDVEALREAAAEMSPSRGASGGS